MRTYNITMIGGFFASDTKEVLHLPLFQDSQHWYLNVGYSCRQERCEEPMNSTSLEPLF